MTDTKSVQVVKMCIDGSALAGPQREALDRNAGAARTGWNWGLGVRNEWERRVTQHIYDTAMVYTGGGEKRSKALSKHHPGPLHVEEAKASGLSVADARARSKTLTAPWLVAAKNAAHTDLGSQPDLDKIFSIVTGVAKPSKDPGKPMPRQWIIDFAAQSQDWSWYPGDPKVIARHSIVTAFRDLDKAISAYVGWKRKPMEQRPWYKSADKLAASRPRGDGMPDGWPRFKAMHMTDPGFSIKGLKQTVDRLTPGGRRLDLGDKIGVVRVHGGTKALRDLISAGGRPSSARLSFVGSRWYVSVNVQFTGSSPARTTARQRSAGAVGVDYGIAKQATFSDGTAPHTNRRTGQKWEARVVRAQHRLERTARPELIEVNGVKRRVTSKGRSDARARLAKVKHLESLDRVLSVHELTKKLATGYQTVVIEDLKVKNMTASPVARPDPENEGQYLPNGAAAKSGLARELLDVMPFEFRRQLQYKTQMYGSEVIVVNARYTSQECAECGHTEKGNRRGETFHCLSCGHRDDADVNAARNILARGAAS